MKEEGDGYGYGSGYGHGNGYGYGHGDGNGYGSGYGDGHGHGSGDGDGNGYGYGHGYGSGYGKIERKERIEMVEKKKHLTRADADEMEAARRRDDKLPYVICRCQGSGVHSGYLVRNEGKEAVLMQSRWIWYWDGAFTLNELAMKGPSRPQNCKFGTQVFRLHLTDVDEIIDVTPEAQKVIESVPEQNL